jgi:hypothetical protein
MPAIDTGQHLFDGKVYINRDSRHRYFVHFVDDASGALSPAKRPPSVTGVTGIIDKSRFLMPWAIRLTTEEIIEATQKLEDEGELLDALMVKNIVEKAAKASDRAKRSAANLGTAVHDWVEKHIRNQTAGEPDPAMPRNKKVRRGVEAFLGWEEAHDVEYLFTERYIYSIEHNFVGTLDIIARVDGLLTLADLKTSKAVYSEYHLQLGGYEIGFNEEFEDPIEQSLILHIPKETGMLSVIDLAAGFEPSDEFKTAAEWNQYGFLAARQLFKHQRGY